MGPPPGALPPANVISMALPHEARGVLDNNDSVKTDGLTGLATVEYRILVPARRSGVILGNRGGVSRRRYMTLFFSEGGARATPVADTHWQLGSRGYSLPSYQGA